jgi:hypothetical protein
LTQTPSERAIAPLWDDLINAQECWASSRTPTPTRERPLIIEWTTFHIESDPRTDSVTFQAILQLNTGPIDGDIVFNYPDLSTGPP